MQNESARDLARGRWAGILGKWLTEKNLSGKHGPCPMCQGKDRFRFDDRDGSGSWICSHCGAGDGFHLLMQLSGMEFKDAARYVEGIAGKIRPRDVQQDQRSQADLIESLRRCWAGAVALTAGDPVHTYLSRRCGITEMPLSVRYHPALPYRHDDGSTTKHPAMVAQVANSEGRCVSIHRTYLTSDGEKANVQTGKKLMTPSERLENVAIRLGRPQDGWLGIAEGIETALAAATIHQHGQVWATVSAGLMETFNPPDGVKLLAIYGDNDASYTGQASAYKLARRLTTQRPEIEVRVVIPVHDGYDWADEYAACGMIAGYCCE